MRCLCVCLYVGHVRSVKTNKHIFKMFSPSGSHIILGFFCIKRHGNIPMETIPTGAWMQVVSRNRDSEPISGLIACCQRCDRQVLSTQCRRKRMASCDTYRWYRAAEFVEGRRWRRNVYDKKSQHNAKDNRTAFNCIRSGKSVAYYVTHNKILYSTFCTIEASFWQTRSIAMPLCDSRATCVVLLSLPTS